MDLKIEARVPKLESLTYDCLAELKTISKTLIEMNRLKRLKLKPKQHVFPLSIQGANREAIKMYDEIQELKLKKEQGEFPSVLTPRMLEDKEFAMKIRGPCPQPPPERGSTEFPAELVPKDPFDDVFAKMTEEERIASNHRCPQCVQSDKDTCNKPICPLDESTSDK